MLELLLHGLERGQVAPVGYLLPTRAATLVPGDRELVLRAVPIAASILGLVLFWRLARSLLDPAGALVGTAAFALNPLLISVGAVVKPYATDVLRVLKPGGWAVIMVPYFEGMLTDEDPSIVDPAERERRFGQQDHVRFYGRDIVDRLTEPGLRVEPVRAQALLSGNRLGREGVRPEETAFVCVALVPARPSLPVRENLVPSGTPVHLLS